jgi:poly(3-hydroxybutyrate) depolymerase
MVMVVAVLLGACTGAGRLDGPNYRAPITGRPPAALRSPAPPVTPPPGCPAADATVTTAAGHPLLVQAAPTDRRRPAVLVLHGFTGSPAAAQADSGLTPAALADGVLVAYPQGDPLADGVGYGWNSGAGIYASTGGDDVGAVEAIIDLLVASYCVDPAHVVLAGESNGGGMAVRGLCDARVNVRVAAAVAVIPAVDAAVIAPCRDATLLPRPLLVIAARADPTVPYAGTPSLLGQETWFTSVAQSLNRCQTVQTGPRLETVTPAMTGDDCGAPATLVSVPSDRHSWPHLDAGFDTNAAVLALAQTRP